MLEFAAWSEEGRRIGLVLVKAGQRDEVLHEQLAYYRARAGEYDEWFLRTGRYDRGEEATEQWFSEVSIVEERLAALGSLGSCLELAAGTGLWSQKLLAKCDRLTVVDGSAEMLAQCRERLGPEAKVRYLEADLFEWRPKEQFDTVYFSFWLSHVPPERFGSFWQLVKAALRPGGRCFFLDSLYVDTSTAANHVLPEREEITLERKLNDGRSFRIYKVFHDPGALTEAIREQGIEVNVEGTGTYFYTGLGSVGE